MSETIDVPAKNSFGKTSIRTVVVHHSFEWNGIKFLVTETLPGSDIVGRENVKYSVTEPTTGMLIKCYSNDPAESEKQAVELMNSKGVEKVKAAIERGLERVMVALLKAHGVNTE